MALHMDDADEFGNKAPQPVDTASIERGSFERLGEGQGAVMAKGAGKGVGKGKSAIERPPLGKRTMVLLIVAAVLVVVLGVALLVRALNSSATTKAGQTVEQTVVGAADTIDYLGVSYALVERVGGYALAESKNGGQFVSLGDIPGEAAALVLFDGTLIIPENLSDGGWDVLAYTIGSGWSKIMDQDGNEQAGKGTISEARLDGSTLRLVVDGTSADVPLVW